MPMIFRATCASLLNFPDKPLPAGFKLVPELAESLPQITNRGKTYTFTVRQGYRFSTGAPVTTRDVAASFKRVLDPKLESSGAGGFLNVVGAPAFNAGKTSRLTGVTVRGNRVVHPAENAYAAVRGIGGGLCVLPAGLPVGPEGARAPVPSAGPYTTTEYVPGRKIVVERNPFYRGPRPHHVDRFDVTLVQDDSTSSKRSRTARSTRRGSGTSRTGSRLGSVPATASTESASSSSRPSAPACCR